MLPEYTTERSSTQDDLVLSPSQTDHAQLPERAIGITPGMYLVASNRSVTYVGPSQQYLFYPRCGLLDRFTLRYHFTNGL
jgi:hypothetical protein